MACKGNVKIVGVFIKKNVGACSIFFPGNSFFFSDTKISGWFMLEIDLPIRGHENKKNRERGYICQLI